MSFEEELRNYQGLEFSNIFIIRLKNKYCLDKKKVKEAILKWDDNGFCFTHRVLKELGFDKEKVMRE